MPCHCGHKVLSTVILTYECEANYVNGRIVLDHKFVFRVHRHYDDIVYRIYSNSGYRYSFLIKDKNNPISLTGEHYKSTPFRQTDWIGFSTDIKFESIYTDEYERVLHSGSWATHYMRPLFHNLKYIRIDNELIELDTWNDGLIDHLAYRVGDNNDNIFIQNAHPFYIPECLSDKYFMQNTDLKDSDKERLSRDVIDKSISEIELFDKNFQPIQNLFIKA